MTTVDPNLLRELHRADNLALPVLIVCGDSCSAVAATLRNQGIRITSTESASVGSIGATITRNQLDILTSIPQITAIEPDQDVRALEHH